MASTQTNARTCPACSALFSATARICPICKMEVAKMAAFAAAKRGLQRTRVESPSTPLYRQLLRPLFIVPVVLAVIVIWYFTRPAPPPAWASLPSTPTAVVQEFLKNVYADNNKNNDVAYSLIAPSVRNAEDSEDRGHYYQIFTTMDHYLGSEFSATWYDDSLKLEADKGDPDLILAHVGAETLHIRVLDQTPADKVAAAGHHYAVAGVDEFNVADAADLQTTAARMSVIGGVAGQQAISNLQSIIQGLGGRRMKPMEAKLNLLPLLRDPRNLSRLIVIKIWTYRTDPVFRDRLERITADGRYGPDVQQAAKDVLGESVSLEDRIAAHCPD